MDAVVLAGDGSAAKRLFETNKALLEIDGRPIIRIIAETLIASSTIDDVVVVGPKAKFEPILEGLDVILVEQRDSLIENGMEGFLYSLPEYRQNPVVTPELEEKYREKAVLGLSCDIPLLCPAEVDQFINQCDLQNYDFISGMSSEDVLRRFEPRDGKRGVEMATIHIREGNIRQNNLHAVKFFKIEDGIKFINKCYEFRYQKELKNVLRSIAELFREYPGQIGHTLYVYFFLQISLMLAERGHHRLANIARYPVSLKSFEKLGSKLMHTRWKTVETDFGGAAIDVDNEDDYLTLKERYPDWVRQISNYHLA